MELNENFIDLLRRGIVQPSMRVMCKHVFSQHKFGTCTINKCNKNNFLQTYNP